MEYKLKVISDSLLQWITKLLYSGEANLFVLKDLKGLNLSSNIFEISIPERKQYYGVIENRLGYLNINESLEKDFVNDILSIGKNAIQKRNYTVEGLLNFLILVDRIDVNGDIKKEVFFAICNTIPINDFKKIVFIFIELLNLEITYKTLLNHVTLDYSTWIDLMTSIEYVEKFDNPVSILRALIRMRETELDLIDIISNTKPQVRALLVQYGFNIDAIPEDKLLNYLIPNGNDIPFFAALIIDNTNAKPNFLSDRLFDLFVVNNWESVGKHIFRRIFSGNRPLNEETKRFFSEKINSWLVQIFVDKQSDNIIERFNWPEDYLAFGGWLSEYSEERKKKTEIVFDDKIIQGLVNGLREVLYRVKVDIPKYLSKQVSFYNSWFTNPNDIKVLYSQTYMTWAMMLCEENDWKMIKKNFKDLCHELRLLGYGSYSGRRLAQDISEHFLGMFFTYPKFEGDNVEGGHRITEILKIFIDVVGMQWVCYTERSKDIWDHENFKPNYGDIYLHYLLNQMNNIPEEYLEIYKPFIDYINRLSTTTWPLSYSHTDLSV